MLDVAVASRRFLTRLGVMFAVAATFLAALGIYGVVSLATARRRREIAIRMAVGASHPNIFVMVLGKASKLALASAVVGLAGGVAVERAMVSLLYEVRPGDLGTLYLRLRHRRSRWDSPAGFAAGPGARPASTRGGSKVRIITGNLLRHRQ